MVCEEHDTAVDEEPKPKSENKPSVEEKSKSPEPEKEQSPVAEEESLPNSIPRFRSKSAPGTPPTVAVDPCQSKSTKDVQEGNSNTDISGHELGPPEISITFVSSMKGSATEGDRNHNTCDEMTKDTDTVVPVFNRFVVV